MSRHEYCDCDDLDQQDMAMWRGRVMSAIRGRRGQQLLRDLRDALDAMPEKRLIAGSLQNTDGVCALGSVCVYRNLNIDDLKFDGDEDDDPLWTNEHLSERLNIAECLVREVEYENDEFAGSPEERWEYMRKWVDRHIKPEPARNAGEVGQP